jgi:hypothetical protein
MAPFNGRNSLAGAYALVGTYAQKKTPGSTGQKSRFSKVSNEDFFNDFFFEFNI